MSSTQGHTNINTNYTTIDISSILSEINRIADETYLRGVEEGHRIANMERAELLNKVTERIHKKMCSENCGERQCVDSMDRCVWYGYVDEAIAEMKSEGEEVS